MRVRSCGVALAIAMWMVAAAWAAPPLTTIQDVLYKADGKPFEGMALIEWKSFQAADFSNIATHSVAVAIVNGVLRVQLVPTTNASAGAYYQVRYNSDGRIQFEERWAVPPSSAPLKLRDVRIAGSVAGGGSVQPPAPSTQLQESDVLGLAEDLAARPVKGPGYTASRAAFINDMGEIEAVSGDAADCVRVDGTAGPCNTGPGFADAETPGGLVDGSNATFTLAQIPNPAESLAVYRNGVLQKRGLDFTASGTAVTFAAASIPQPGDVLLASYRLAAAGAPATGTPTGQVICSSTGTGTNAGSLTRLGSCTIQAGLLKAGDRVDIRFSYSHEGTTNSPTFEVHWGGTTIVSRTPAAAETYMTGRIEAGVHNTGAEWSVESWGVSLALAASAGTATDSLASPLVIDLVGKMAAGGGADTITLRNFTVLRWPAQANP